MCSACGVLTSIVVHTSANLRVSLSKQGALKNSIRYIIQCLPQEVNALHNVLLCITVTLQLCMAMKSQDLATYTDILFL